MLWPVALSFGAKSIDIMVTGMYYLRCVVVYSPGLYSPGLVSVVHVYTFML